MNRRQFLQSGATAAFAIATTPAWAAEFADMKKRVGLIGCGWYGKCDLFRLLQVAPVEVVSLCDVDKKMLDDAADQIAARQASKKRPRTYGDYRQMLAEKDLDIVLVETPDHWHALPMIDAVKAGAHVWVQKPTSVDVVESQAMLAAARKHNRVVQVNTQRRSTPHLVEAREEFIQGGKLGKVAHVEICCYYHMRNRKTATEAPDKAPPEHLDYEMWTGPAPARPYNEIIHPRGWRAFMEYGNGIVGDMCIHMLDTARWMLDLGMPRRVTSTGGILVQKQARSNIADTQNATFEFDGVNVVWTHRTWGTTPDPKYPWAAVFHGDKGTLKTSVMSYDFIPQGKGEPVHKDVGYELEQFPEDKTEKDLEKHCAPALRAHWKDFLRAIERRGKPVADIEQGVNSTIASILANLSMQLGRTLEWDAAAGQVKNDAEANRLLRRPYRAPWTHPEPGSV
jgi:predicted dehydrogenase